MDKPLVPLRDVFWLRRAALTIALLTQWLGYLSHQWLLALGLIVAAMLLSCFVGAWVRDRRSAVLNPYSVTMAIAAPLFVFKWSAAF